MTEGISDLNTGNLRAGFGRIVLLIIIVASLASLSFVSNGRSSPSSAYYYSFTVDEDGFTYVVIRFNSTDRQGNSWVFVPKSSNWTYSITTGQILNPEVVDTSQVTGLTSQDFYQAFQFGYQSNGFFNMTIQYGFENGALIIEPRGVFYSPLIGFEPVSGGTAELFLYHGFTINSKLAVVVGSNRNYPAQQAQPNHALFSLSENIVRLQVEFSTNTTPQYKTLTSNDNKTFTFKTLTRYQSYASSVLAFCEGTYGSFTGLFNVTLSGVIVQWFLPEFQDLLIVGGYVPVLTSGLGEININIAFVRGVNGTIDVIAAHELVHRFLGKAGLSPDDFLWFHEGMAQYISLNCVLNLGYTGAEQQKDDLESYVSDLAQSSVDTNFNRIGLQDWSPSYQPSEGNVTTLYAAAYYVVSRLPEDVKRSGFDYYGRFFKLIQNAHAVNGTTINNLSLLALYLSEAAGFSVAPTFRRWGFTLKTDLYNSTLTPLIEEVSSAIDATNPVFQPYRAFAEYFYQQALQSVGQGDENRARSLLQIAVTLADLAPFLTFLTILVILVLLVLILSRRKPKPKPAVPKPPEWMMQPPTS